MKNQPFQQGFLVGQQVRDHATQDPATTSTLPPPPPARADLPTTSGEEEPGPSSSPRWAPRTHAARLALMVAFSELIAAEEQEGPEARGPLLAMVLRAHGGPHSITAIRLAIGDHLGYRQMPR